MREPRVGGKKEEDELNSLKLILLPILISIFRLILMLIVMLIRHRLIHILLIFILIRLIIKFILMLILILTDTHTHNHRCNSIWVCYRVYRAMSSSFDYYCRLVWQNYPTSATSHQFDQCDSLVPDLPANLASFVD